MKIAIVEDERSERQLLTEYLKQYERENGQAFEIHAYRDGDEILRDYSADFDLILMDIEMAFVDGMTAAREIRKVDGEVALLFITNAPQYVMQGYEVDALDYLVKPVSYFALAKRLDKVVRRMARKPGQFIRLSVRGGFQRVDVNHILYVETDTRGVVFHTLQGDCHTRNTMREVEALLGGPSFFRCNKCYLVNLRYIDGMVGSDISVGGTAIQVSRAQKKPMLDAMNRYLSDTEL